MPIWFPEFLAAEPGKSEPHLNNELQREHNLYETSGNLHTGDVFHDFKAGKATLCIHRAETSYRNVKLVNQLL